MNNNEFFIYAIASLKNKRIYVGISRNVEQRIRQHNAGKVFSTNNYSPWVRFFIQFAGNAPEARKIKRIFFFDIEHDFPF